MESKAAESNINEDANGKIGVRCLNNFKNLLISNFELFPKLTFVHFSSNFFIETEAVSVKRRSKRLAVLKTYQTVQKEPPLHFESVRQSRSEFKNLPLFYKISSNKQDENGSAKENLENEAQSSRSPSTPKTKSLETVSEEAQKLRSTSTQAKMNPEDNRQLHDNATWTPLVTPLRFCLSTPERSTPVSANRRVYFVDTRTVTTFMTPDKFGKGHKVIFTFK